MKKIITFILMLTVVISAVGCSKTEEVKEEPKPHVEGTLEEIMAKIYEGVESGMTEIRVIDDESKEYILGTSDIDFEEGIASEAMITTYPHSIALLRVKEDADVEAIKQTIKENVNPRKWICVEVPEDQVVVDNIGDLVILIMDKDSQPYYDNFKALLPQEGAGE